MERIRLDHERSDKLQRFKTLEFNWHAKYWDERAYWKFTAAEIDLLEAATEAVWEMAQLACEHVIATKQLPLFGYTPEQAELIEWSWKNRSTQSTLYQRIDLAFNGEGPPKLLEINGDTPTSLYEAGVVQWDWMEQLFGGSEVHGSVDQWNSIHDNLIAALQRVRFLQKTSVHDPNVDYGLFHTTCVSENDEDKGTTWYINYLAEEQGMSTKHVPIEEIAWREKEYGVADRFVDQDGLTIKTMFKLYPWEWLLSDEFGPNMMKEVMEGRIKLIEPAWKMLLSNKRLLTTMWELFPFHPNLLQTTTNPAVFADQKYVKKAILGREGQSVSIIDKGRVVEAEAGTYDDGDFVFQEYYELPRAHGHTAVLGSWIINGEAAGMGIRESKSLITNNMAHFVPHIFTPHEE